MSNRSDLRAEELDWSRTNPCNDCPFLRGTPFHEGVAAGLPNVEASMSVNVFAHTCHKTDNSPNCDGPRNYPGRTQHCAGAILMLLKTGRGMDLQIPLLQAAERGEVDLRAMSEKAKARKDVHTLWSFMRFYADCVRAMKTADEEGD